MCGTMFGTMPPHFWILFRYKRGRRFSPVPQAQHLIKRYKYEFLPHAMPTLRKSYLTCPSFRIVQAEFENPFSLSTAPQPLRCETSWLSSGFMLYWRQKKAVCSITCGLHDMTEIYADFVADHTFDHLRLRTTRILCREEHTKAVNPDEKAPKSP